MTTRKYWIYSPGERAKKWDEFYAEGIMALGWSELGDLNDYEDKKEIAKALRVLENTESSKKNDATANYDFKEVMSKGDVVIAKKGTTSYIGYGIVTSDYIYDNSRGTYKHLRKVDWKSNGSWEDKDIIVKTLTNITKYKDYVDRLVTLLGIGETKKSLMNNELKYPLNTILYGPPGTGKTYHTILRAAEIIENRKMSDYGEAKLVFNNNLRDRIEFITFHQNYSYEDFIQGLRPDVDNGASLTFERKDGIFKSISDSALDNYKAFKATPETIAKSVTFERALDSFSENIQDSEGDFSINDTAHIFEVEEAAFRYTGKTWLNRAVGNRMKFSDLKEFYKNDVQERKDIKKLNNISGLAKQHATYFFLVYSEILKLVNKNTDDLEDIKSVELLNYVIVIDEINRANISRVFGELITLIEPDKRFGGEVELSCKLPSGEKFSVPPNLYIIGAMNTADKSIALLDIALRRRFEFIAMYPNYDIPGIKIYDVEVLKKLNEKIIKLKGHDFQIGHAYFMGDNNNLKSRMDKKVIPLLLEYFMNDKDAVIDILKHAGLDIEKDTWPLKIKA